MPQKNVRSWRWVLAETGIVVAGILIAFSLNSWWDGRAAAEREQAHLQALEADFGRNVQQLEALVGFQESVADASLGLLLIARGQEAAEAVRVERLMGQVFASDRFDATMGAYEDLVNSGGLAQIRDERLRASLATFASMLDSRYAEQYATSVYLDFNRAFLGRLGWADGVLQQLEGEGAGGGPGVATAWNHALLDDPVFQEHLALRHLAEQQVAEVYRALAEQARVVLERIERERS